MPKFFVLPEKITENHLVVDSEDVNHITRVLRLKEGDRISVCDGQGYDYEAQIQRLEKRRVICSVLSKTIAETEPEIEVVLFQALPKASKMEYIIQKTTELGISKIVPCRLSRCVVHLDAKNASKKAERWQKIAEAAAKQCGRGKIPQILPVTEFKEAVEQMKQAELSFAPYECEEQNCLKPVLHSVRKPRTVSFMIGPEGGFDPAEIEFIRKSGIIPVTLGKRILRTETAGEAVLSMIMYEIGDINEEE